MIPVNYDHVPIPTVIDLLEQLSGKKYIRDQNLDGVPPITFKATGLSKDEEIRFITSTLLLNGVAILPVDDRTMKVLTTGTNKNPRSEGVRTYANEADLPAGDEIVTYYMPLDHINAGEAVGIFTQVAPVHIYGNYVPAVSANAVILTENVSVIRELISLKKEIDVRNPGPPRRPDDSPPPGRPPPAPHDDHPLVGLLAVGLVIVVATALGNILAHVWLGRNRAKSPS